MTGLASEAAVFSEIAGDNGGALRVVCAGASTERAASLARELVAQGVEALLSFGIAGAADSNLESGDLIIADQVLTDDANLYPCNLRWLKALSAALDEEHLAVRHGTILGSSRLWRDTKDKAAIHEITGAIAIDMESGAVAAAAAQAALPFLAVRAIADRVQDSLPAIVETAVKSDGTAAIGRALVGLARRPGELPATLRLARQTNLALAGLRRLAAVREVLLGGF